MVYTSRAMFIVARHFSAAAAAAADIAVKLVLIVFARLSSAAPGRPAAL